MRYYPGRCRGLTPCRCRRPDLLVLIGISEAFVGHKHSVALLKYEAPECSPCFINATRKNGEMPGTHQNMGTSTPGLCFVTSQ